MTDVLIGVSAFAVGVMCGAMIVGPKMLAVVSGTLSQMKHDLNPRRDSPTA